MSLAWALHKDFGIYLMSWEDALVSAAMGIVLGILVAAVVFLRR